MTSYLRHVIGLFVALVVLTGVSTPVLAESGLCVTVSCVQAGISARLNVEVVVPGSLYFRLGNPSGSTNLNFDVGSTPIGTPVAATGGDAAGGSAVGIELRSNFGQPVTMTIGLGQAALTDGGADSIPWNDFTLNQTVGAGLAPPPLVNGSSVVYPDTGGVIDLSGEWTLTYLNSAFHAAGSYLGDLDFTITLP